MPKWFIKYIIIIIILVTTGMTSYAQEATSTDTLKNKIDERNNQIKQLEEEIKQYNSEILNATNQAKTLQNTIKTLDLTKRKIVRDVNLTEKKINKTVLTIEELETEISKTKTHINLNKKAIITALQGAQVLDDMNIVAIILSKKNISDIWNDVDNSRQIRETVREKSKELVALQKEMEIKESNLKDQKSNLLNLRQDLNGKKQAVEYTVQEKTTILAQTKNKEQTFKELVKTKEEQKAQFEKEVYDYESQLNYLIGPKSFPRPKNGILSWPLENIFITQKFGKTIGAEKLYTSGSHNGVDFRASVGTGIKNVLDGTVVGTGNTDFYSGCYSFGKWVMVKHDNGLSTIYGHLSVISVSTEQRLNTGDLIGYSGNTGYSTGPHLHISLYATQGVRIEKYVNSRGCKEVIMPLADIRAYLDPLAYLPSL